MMQFSSPLLFDITFVMILIASIAIAAKMGAFKAISGIAGTLVGLVCGLLFEGRIAPQIESVLTPVVEKAVGSLNFSEFMQLGSETMASLSQELADVIAAWEQNSGGQIPAELASALTGEIVPRLASVLSFLVIFLCAKLVVIIVLHLFNDYIPVFRTLSKGLGAVLGAASGLLIILVLCWAVLNYAPADEAAGIINQQSLRESHIGSMLCPFFD